MSEILIPRPAKIIVPELRVIQAHGKLPMNLHDAYGVPLPNVDCLETIATDLQQAGIQTKTLRTPQPAPHMYWPYEAAFKQAEPDEFTIGNFHSLAGGGVLRFMSENKKVRFGQINILACCLGLNWPMPERAFFEFDIDPDTANRTEELNFFHSLTDSPAVQAGRRVLRKIFPNANHYEILDAGHLTHGTTPSGQFPELITVIKCFVARRTSSANNAERAA